MPLSEAERRKEASDLLSPRERVARDAAARADRERRDREDRQRRELQEFARQKAESERAARERVAREAAARAEREMRESEDRMRRERDECARQNAERERMARERAAEAGARAEAEKIESEQMAKDAAARAERETREAEERVRREQEEFARQMVAREKMARERAAEAAATRVKHMRRLREENPLMTKLMSSSPVTLHAQSRLSHMQVALEAERKHLAFKACEGDAEQADAMLLRYKSLSHAAFALKAKEYIATAKTQRSRYGAWLGQITKLSSSLQQVRQSRSAEEFAAKIDASPEEEVEALSFAVNAALVSGLGPDAQQQPWARMIQGLDTAGLSERRSALSRPEEFFEELLVKESQEQERLIQCALASAASTILDQLTAPTLQPLLAEFGITLQEVLPVLKSACHGDWDELTPLLNEPRRLVKQAAAVKSPVATLEFRFELEVDHRDTNEEDLKKKFAQVLGVSRMLIAQIELAPSPSERNKSRVEVKVNVIDAEAGDAVLNRLKFTKSSSVKVLGARVLGFPVILGIKMNQHKNAKSCRFHVLLASELRKEGSPSLCGVRHQQINTSWFYTMEVTMQGVMQALDVGKTLVVSHRWCAKDRPDAEGLQEQLIKEYLREHRSIEYVWYDYWCMPQLERSEAEEVSFAAMLRSVNLLYLGGTVLVLLDEEYLKRFWTSAEFWLSTRTCTPTGLQPAENPEQRCKIVLLPGAPRELKGAMIAQWARLTISQACDLLRLEEIRVTNQRDKDELIPKIERLDEAIQGAWATAQETELIKLCPLLEQVIDKSPARPLEMGDDGLKDAGPSESTERPPPLPKTLSIHNMSFDDGTRPSGSKSLHSGWKLVKANLSRLKKVKAAEVDAAVSEGEAEGDPEPRVLSLEELREMGLSAEQLRDRGFTAGAQYAGGLPVYDLSLAFADVEVAAFAYELLQEGCDADTLRTEASICAWDLKRAGYSAGQLYDGGFDVSELRDAGFDAGTLHAARISALELTYAGYSALELFEGFYDASELRDAGISARDLKPITASSEHLLRLGELVAAGYSLSELQRAGMDSMLELRSLGNLAQLGIDAHALKEANFTARQLRYAGYEGIKESDVLTAGFSAGELLRDGFSVKALKEAGYTAAEMREGGATADALLQGGFEKAAIFNAGFSNWDLLRSKIPALKEHAANALRLPEEV